MTTMPLNPLYKSKVFWGGIGFAGLLFLSPIPGWILLGGIGYGFYRLFRYLRSAQDVLFGARNGLLSTDGDASSLLDTLFSRDPHTKQIAAKIQEMAMERVETAIETNEEGIQRLFPVRGSDMSGEFHFSFPTEVSMLNSNVNIMDMNVPEVTFEVQIKFIVYLASEEGRRGAQIMAKAKVLEEGVKLTTVDVRDTKTGRKVKLKGEGRVLEGNTEREIFDESGIGKGEGEGKTIDATRWTSR